jgi:hypothetical protein
MSLLSKEALLGATDIVERDVDLRPHIQGSVRVRTLPAAYSNDAQSQALEVVTDPRTQAQSARVNTAKLEELQVLHGLVEPKLDTIEEVRQLAQKIGPSWRLIVNTIDELSGIDKEAIDQANRAFQPGGREEDRVPGSNGVAPGDRRSDLDVPAGA